MIGSIEGISAGQFPMPCDYARGLEGPTHSRAKQGLEFRHAGRHDRAACVLFWLMIEGNRSQGQTVILEICLRHLVLVLDMM
jgi:hypothetical protein